MPIDQKGRCKKLTDDGSKINDDTGFKLSLSIPSLKRILNWLLIFLIIMPWISVIVRYNIIVKLFNKFEEFITISTTEDTEAPKKMDYFIKNVYIP